MSSTFSQEICFGVPAPNPALVGLGVFPCSPHWLSEYVALSAINVLCHMFFCACLKFSFSAILVVFVVVCSSHGRLRAS